MLSNSQAAHSFFFFKQDMSAKHFGFKTVFLVLPKMPCIKSLIFEIEKFLLCKETCLLKRCTELFLTCLAGIQNETISALKVIQNILVHKLKEQKTKLISDFELLFDMSFGFIGMSLWDNVIHPWLNPVPCYAKGFYSNLPKSPTFSYYIFFFLG